MISVLVTTPGYDVTTPCPHSRLVCGWWVITKSKHLLDDERRCLMKVDEERCSGCGSTLRLRTVTTQLNNNMFVQGSFLPGIYNCSILQLHSRHSQAKENNYIYNKDTTLRVGI